MNVLQSTIVFPCYSPSRLVYSLKCKRRENISNRQIEKIIIGMTASDGLDRENPTNQVLIKARKNPADRISWHTAIICPVGSIRR